MLQNILHSVSTLQANKCIPFPSQFLRYFPNFTIFMLKITATVFSKNKCCPMQTVLICKRWNTFSIQIFLLLGES